MQPSSGAERSSVAGPEENFGSDRFKDPRQVERVPTQCLIAQATDLYQTDIKLVPRYGKCLCCHRDYMENHKDRCTIESELFGLFLSFVEANSTYVINSIINV
jgi:hypothetical protein